MPIVSGVHPLKKGPVKCAKWLLAILNLASLSLLVSSNAIAQTAEPSDTQVAPSAFVLRGFGTLGFARSTGGDLGYLRDISQPKGIDSNWSAKQDSTLGVQANYRIADNLGAAMQVVSHYRYDETFTPEVTGAYVKYDPTPSLTFRVGRIGTELLINADSSKIGYSYLTVRPPPEFFAGLVVNYGDGADMQIRYPMGEGIFLARCSWAEPAKNCPCGLLVDHA